MTGLIELEKILSKGKQEIDTVRTLYLVMGKVGGYEQLMNLPIPALNEIIKCIEWEIKENEKQVNRGKGR